MKLDWEKRMPLAKACPFCGSKEVLTEKKAHFEQSMVKTCTFIRCDGCGVQLVGEPVDGDDGHFVQDYNVCQRQALRMWNRRVTA